MAWAASAYLGIGFLLAGRTEQTSASMGSGTVVPPDPVGFSLLGRCDLGSVHQNKVWKVAERWEGQERQRERERIQCPLPRAETGLAISLEGVSESGDTGRLGG